MIEIFWRIALYYTSWRIQLKREKKSYRCRKNKKRKVNLIAFEGNEIQRCDWWKLSVSSRKEKKFIYKISCFLCMYFLPWEKCLLKSEQNRCHMNKLCLCLLSCALLKMVFLNDFNETQRREIVTVIVFDSMLSADIISLSNALDKKIDRKYESSSSTSGLSNLTSKIIVFRRKQLGGTTNMTLCTFFAGCFHMSRRKTDKYVCRSFFSSSRQKEFLFDRFQ